MNKKHKLFQHCCKSKGACVCVCVQMNVASLRDQILLGLRAFKEMPALEDDAHAHSLKAAMVQHPDTFSEAFALFCVEEMVLKPAF